MRIALAQLNPTVGDIEGNARMAARAVERAHEEGAELVLLPELTLTGYPPEDLLGKDHFVRDNIEALKALASQAPVRTVVGFVDEGKTTLFNAAALLQGGKVAQVYHKRRLPNYGVFDEERYFEPGSGLSLFKAGDSAASMTICEDVWSPEVPADSAEHGAKLILNISASPFHLQKGAEREAMLRTRAEDNSAWLAYCNIVGGQDELVFDGRSVVIAPDGIVVARAKAFEEDLLVVDVPDDFGESYGLGRIEPLLEAEEEVYGALKTGLGDYIRKNSFSDVVVGLSGGIDSALTATLAADTLGPERVHGVMMPSMYSSEGSVTDARQLGETLGIDVRELPIAPAFDAFMRTLQPSFDDLPPNVAEENLQARIRGSLLMALSNKFGWLVLATGNKSELSVGYSTLYGDMVGGFAPLKDVFKTRVYDLARWRNQLSPAIPQESIDKPPSAELKPGQVDRDALPAYEELDAVLRMYVEEDVSQAEIVQAGFDEDTVARVARMVDAAEYKRRQGPLGIKVSPKAFGKDRRMPVTNRYRG